MVTASIFWYDYETTGIDPRRDRPLQVAGIRTDEALNEIGEPLNLYCRLSDDILPHPAACLVTGISPSRLQERGLDEAEFMARLHAELCQPSTCVAGYNSLRFDDEVTRFSLYRNFYDPYGREWQSGNSRWDLIDLVRTAYALRPEGIEWPKTDDGRVTLKLELLTQANGLAHGQAHDALSDVRATIALARLLRDRQPKLYAYLYALRSKHRVMEQVQLLRPLVHISGRYAGERSYLSIVLPLAWHPTNRNALVVCDLQVESDDLMSLSGEQLRERLYTRHTDLKENERPVPLKLVHINKCPVVAPLSVLREADQTRLGIDLSVCERRAQGLRDQQSVWQDKLSTVYATQDFSACDDPEQQLYDGFLGERDKRLCTLIRSADPAELNGEDWTFADPRLTELLFRYRARNYPHTLSPQEQQDWHQFCQQRLRRPEYGAPLTYPDFCDALEQSALSAPPEKSGMLDDWRAYGEKIASKYGLE